MQLRESGPLAASDQLTYRDFAALPDDGRRYEILDGELFMSPSPIPHHQQVAFNLARLMAEFAERNNAGTVFVAPLDVLLSRNDIVSPDVVYVARAQRRIIRPKHIRGVPHLLVEILSPSTQRRDTRDKKRIYARCGVPFYWIVDLKRRTFVEFQLVGSAYQPATTGAQSDVLMPLALPKFRLPLQRVWP